MELQHDRTITISIGASRKATQWSPATMTVGEFYERFRNPLRGTENLTDYLAMKKALQDELKDVGGFVGGTLSGPRRKAANVTGRDVVTLDFDNIPPYAADKVLAAADALGCSYCIYSTRKHREEAPRLRVMFVSDRTMTVEEHEAAARRLAEQIGISWVDPTTFEAPRLMYWPSCSQDGDYIFKVKDAPLFRVDKVLESYTDWHDTTSWPQVPGAVSYQKLAAKQGDPESKPGVVGAFCRTYDVYRALDELIPELYEAVDTDPNRFTYLGGSTTGGAIVYDHGRFLFSHHATDPCSGKLVNSFDLVRLHKYGDLDDTVAVGTPNNRLPSYKAMCEYAVADAAVAALMARERAEDAVKDFDGVTATNDQDNAWMMGLKYTTNGQVAHTAANILYTLENDPKLKGRMVLDTFADRIYGIAPLPWGNHANESGQFPWKDADDDGLTIYIERLLGFRAPSIVVSALNDHLARHTINPVQDYLKSLEWDGVPRLDTLFVDYLGAADSSYTRATTRKSFTAAVTRAMTPGCKFDYMLILSGPQGIGKSTILWSLADPWFTDSLKTFEGKEASELLQGVWLVEIAELQAFGKSDVARIKQFISTRDDRYRAAYGHRPASHPRRCVFVGTCNPGVFLRDPTGGRRFWPVYVGLQPPTKSIMNLPQERDQIWAKAKVRWQLGEPLYLTGELEKQALAVQESAREVDEREGLIESFLDEPIPTDWPKWSLDRRRDFWAGGIQGAGKLELTPRTGVCVMEIWTELFGKNKADLSARDSRAINDILENLPGWMRSSKRERFGPHGQQRGFVRR